MITNVEVLRGAICNVPIYRIDSYNDTDKFIGVPKNLRTDMYTIYGKSRVSLVEEGKAVDIVLSGEQELNKAYYVRKSNLVYIMGDVYINRSRLNPSYYIVSANSMSSYTIRIDSAEGELEDMQEVQERESVIDFRNIVFCALDCKTGNKWIRDRSGV